MVLEDCGRSVVEIVVPVASGSLRLCLDWKVQTVPPFVDRFLIEAVVEDVRVESVNVLKV